MCSMAPYKRTGHVSCLWMRVWHPGRLHGWASAGLDSHGGLQPTLVFAGKVVQWYINNVGNGST